MKSSPGDAFNTAPGLIIKSWRLPMTSKTNNPIRLIMEAGQVYGRLTAVAFMHVGKSRHKIWTFRCECGNEKTAATTSVWRGSTRSCGCLHRESIAANGRANVTHGMTRSPEYYVWKSMLQRCKNPNTKNFKRYGGRGITVCDRWLIFENFYADMGARHSKTHSIERIENTGPYCKDNCKWATRTEQARNRRSNLVVIVNGVSMTLAEAVEISGLKYTTVRRRIELGWDISRAIRVVAR